MADNASGGGSAKKKKHNKKHGKPQHPHEAQEQHSCGVTDANVLAAGQVTVEPVAQSAPASDDRKVVECKDGAAKLAGTSDAVLKCASSTQVEFHPQQRKKPGQDKVQVQGNEKPDSGPHKVMPVSPKSNEVLENKDETAKLISTPGAVCDCIQLNEGMYQLHGPEVLRNSGPPKVMPVSLKSSPAVGENIAAMQGKQDTTDAESVSHANLAVQAIGQAAATSAKGKAEGAPEKSKAQLSRERREKQVSS